MRTYSVSPSQIPACTAISVPGLVYLFDLDGNIACHTAFTRIQSPQKWLWKVSEKVEVRSPVIEAEDILGLKKYVIFYMCNPL